MKQNTKKLLLSILTAFAVVLLAACGAHNKQNTKTNTSSSASEISIKSAAGETKVPINPKKLLRLTLVQPIPFGL